MLSAKTILLIEDDHDNRVAIRLVLEENGYEVLTAANGKIGMELLRKGAKPALILLDMVMPIMDGQEFLKKLKNHTEFANFPVLVISSFKEKMALIENRPFMLKPLDLDKLLEKIPDFLKGCTP